LVNEEFIFAANVCIGSIFRLETKSMHLEGWKSELLSSDEIDLFYNSVGRKISKFCVVHETWTRSANLLHFYLELNAIVAYEAVARF